MEKEMKNAKLWKQIFDELFDDYEIIHEDNVSIYIEEKLDGYTRTIGIEKTDFGIKMISGENVDNIHKSADLIVDNKIIHDLFKSNYNHVKSAVLDFAGIMLNLPNDILLTLSLQAHDQDMTLNQYVNLILRSTIDQQINQLINQPVD
jgi:hypothetical protein